MEFKEKRAGLAYTLSAVMPFIFQLFVTIFVLVLANILEVDGSELTKNAIVIWVLLFMNQFAFFWCIYYTIIKNKLSVKDMFGINKKALQPRYLLLGGIAAIGLIFFMSPIVSAFVSWLQTLGYTPNADVLPKEFTWYNFLLGIVVLCILPSVIEEGLFRGIVLFGIKGASKVFSIVVCALLFTIMHQSIEQFLHQFVFSLMLCYVAVQTKSILIPIILHFINNFIALTFNYFPYSEQSTWILFGIGGALFLAVCLFEFVFKKPIKVEASEQAIVSTVNKKVFFTYAAFGITFNIVMIFIGLFT